MPAKLLIADDSTTIQKVFERTFPPEEFTLSFANNGDEALTKAKMDKPHVIIADINMPAKNGFEVCEELKKDPALRGTPVLLLIGILDDFDEDEGRRVGADGFIIKPFESNAAISKVREALAKGGSVPPTEGPAPGGAEEILDLTNIAQKPTATPPKKEAEDILTVADILEEPSVTPAPSQEKAEEIMELTDVEEPASQPPPPPKKMGAEDILNVADILEEPSVTPAPSQEKAEEIIELTDVTTETIPAPSPPEKAAEDIFELPDIPEETPAAPPPQEKGTEDIFELPDIEVEPEATPSLAPPQEKKEEEGFILQTSLRDLEEELKAEFPEGKTGLEQELKAEVPEEEAEVKEDLSAPVKEEDFGSLELELPFDESEPEPRAKDADWTTLFGELGLDESGEEAKQERLGTILDESTSELEKIEGLGTPKKEKSEEEETFTKKFREPFFGEDALRPEKIEGLGTLKKEEGKEEEFAEKFMDDFEPVFEPSEDFQDIVTREKDITMTAREGTEDLAEKVASTVGHELQEVVEKVIKEKVPELVRQEIDRLKKE